MKSLLVTIVIYKESLENTNAYKSILHSIDSGNLDIDITVYIYDNSPESHRIAVDVPNIVYIHNSSNPGVSVAYNSAYKYAKANGIGWILLLDQDTIISSNYIRRASLAIAKYGAKFLYAPLLYDQNGKMVSPFHRLGKVAYPIRSNNISGVLSSRRCGVINSGIIISTQLYEYVGGYDDSISLDFSDVIFIERYARKVGCLIIIKEECKQNLSTYETDIDKLRARFALFCRGAAAIRPNNLCGKIQILFVVYKRMLSLIIRTHDVSFYNILISNYIKS